jgi:hypothetical protein
MLRLITRGEREEGTSLAVFATFIPHPGYELLRIPLLRTRVNSGLEQLEVGLVDRAVPFDS